MSDRFPIWQPPAPDAEDMAKARALLLDARDELAERIRREKAAESAAQPAGPPPTPPGMTLGQKLDTVLDRLDALEQRMDLAAKWAAETEQTLRACGVRPRTKKASRTGTPHPTETK